MCFHRMKCENSLLTKEKRLHWAVLVGKISQLKFFYYIMWGCHSEQPSPLEDEFMHVSWDVNLTLSLLSDWLILFSPWSHGRPVGSHPLPDVHVLLLLRTVGHTKPPFAIIITNNNNLCVCLLCVVSWLYYERRIQFGWCSTWNYFTHRQPFVTVSRSVENQLLCM